MDIKANWNSDQAARRIGLPSGAALEVARHRGSIAIPVIHVGKRGIRYDPDDVEKWLLENKEVPGAAQKEKRADKPAGLGKRQRRLRSGK